MEWLQNNHAVIKDFVETLSSLLTITAILTGALWAYRLFWLKRQKYPRVSIGLQITQEPLTNQTRLVNVSVNLANDGEVLVRLKSSEIWIQQILPLSQNVAELLARQRDIVGLLREQVIEESSEMWQTEIPWPVIADYAVQMESWHRKEIEPGLSIQLRYDFILDRQVQLVKIYTFYENAAKRPRRVRGFLRGKKHIMGWDCATLYRLESTTEH